MIQNIFLEKWLEHFNIICIRAKYVSILIDVSLCTLISLVFMVKRLLIQ
jgi:hypothetical protein